MSIVKLNNNGVKNATEFGSITGLGSMVFIKKVTASSSATVSFVDGTSDVVLDNTYKEYLFTYNNIHPATDDVKLVFQATTNGSDFNTTVTNTYFLAQHTEDDSSTSFTYSASDDQAQGTAFQRLNESTGSDNDQSISGYLHLFEPSSTTFVKNYLSRSSSIFDQASDVYGAGYFNTTSAITGIQFKFSSGNMDAGDICLYGIA